MKILFKVESYLEPEDLDAPVTDLDKWPRITGLSWIVISNENKIVRGFRFKIKHTVGETGFPPELQKIEEEQGNPAKYIIDRFLSYYDSADVLIAHGLKRNFGLLAAEAIRYKSRAKTRIESKFCTIEDVDPILYADDERTLSALYFSLFGSYIDDDLEPTKELSALAEIVEEIVLRGALKPAEV
jgi:hypothetical protein